MIPLGSKPRLALVGVSVVILLIIITHILYSPSDPSLTSTPDIQPQWYHAYTQGFGSNSKPKQETFVYNPYMHANYHALTSSQCRAAFPRLYFEIDRAVEHRRNTGINITMAHLDTAAAEPNTVRVAIRNNRIHIINNTAAFQRPRTFSVISQIYRALMAMEAAGQPPLPDVEFVLGMADWPSQPHQWAMSREINVDLDTWVIPDFVFWAIPTETNGEYEEIRLRMWQGMLPFEQKTPQLLWRGFIGSSDLRTKLKDVMEGHTWADFSAVDWRMEAGDSVARPAISSQDVAIPIWEQCNWKYLAYTEGFSYSSRLRYHLNCESVVFVHKLKWVEYFSNIFVTEGPDQNVVEVERDFSDLSTKIEELIANPDKAKAIAQKSAHDFRDRNLTPAALSCYWREMIIGWAKVQSYAVDPYRDELDKHGMMRKIPRGKPYEMWIVEAS